MKRLCIWAVSLCLCVFPEVSTVSAVEIGVGTTISVSNADWATKLPDDVIFSGGKLISTLDGTATISRNLTFTQGTSSIIQSDGSASQQYGGALLGAGNFQKSGGQQLHLFGDSTGFSGTLTVSTSWVNFRNPEASLSAGTLHFDGGSGIVFSPSVDNSTFSFGMITSTAGTNPEIRVTSYNSHPITLEVGGSNASGTFSGHIQDKDAPLSVTKTGTGVWTLTGSNTWTGATVISGGTLQFGDGTTAGSFAGITTTDVPYVGNRSSITVNENATLAFNQSGIALRIYNPLTFNGGTLNTSGRQVNISSVISGTKLIKEGTGVVYFQGGTGTSDATVSVAELVVNGGTLATKAALTSATTSLTVNDGGTFQLGSAGSPTLGSLNSATAITVNAGGTFAVFGRSGGSAVANNITFNGGNITSQEQSATFSGAFSGTGLVKTGSGTVTLSKTNATFSGSVRVSEGTLAVGGTLSGSLSADGTDSVLQLGTGSNSGALAASSVIALSNGGTFALNRNDGTAGNFPVPNTLTVTNGGTIANRNSRTIVLQGTISGNDLTLSNEGSGSFFLQHNNGTTLLPDFSGLTGTLTIARGTIVDKNQNVGSAADPLHVLVKSGATLQMGNANNIAVSKINGTIEIESGGQILLGYAPSGTTAVYANEFSGAGKIAACDNITKLTGDNRAFAGTVAVAAGEALVAMGDNTLGNSAVMLNEASKLTVEGDQSLRSMTLKQNSDLYLNSGTVSVSGEFSEEVGAEIHFLISQEDSPLLSLDGTGSFNGSALLLDTNETLDVGTSYEFLRGDSLDGLVFALSQTLLDQGMSVRETAGGMALQNVSAFPEPSSWVLMLLGSVWIWNKKRKQKINNK